MKNNFKRNSRAIFLIGLITISTQTQTAGWTDYLYNTYAYLKDKTGTVLAGIGITTTVMLMLFYKKFITKNNSLHQPTPKVPEHPADQPTKAYTDIQENIDTLINSAEKYFINYQNNPDVVKGRSQDVYYNERIINLARIYKKSIVDALLHIMNAPLPEKHLPQLFNYIHQKGIDLYCKSYLTPGLFKINMSEDTGIYSFLTQYLQTIYNRLDEKTQQSIDSQLQANVASYHEKMAHLPTTILDKIRANYPLPTSQQLHKTELQALNSVIQKFGTAFKNNPENIVFLGQSLSYVYIIAKICALEPFNNAIIFPFSKGNSAPFSEQKTAANATSILEGNTVELPSLSTATKLEKILFSAMQEKFGISDNSALCDMLESGESIQSFENFLKNKPKHYFFQVYSEALKNRLVLRYKQAEWYKNIQSRAVIVDEISTNQHELRMGTIAVGRSDEQNRLVPIMTPSMWLFGIPCIAQKGYIPSDQATENIRQYLEEYCPEKLTAKPQ